MIKNDLMGNPTLLTENLTRNELPSSVKRLSNLSLLRG